MSEQVAHKFIEALRTLEASRDEAAGVIGNPLSITTLRPTTLLRARPSLQCGTSAPSRASSVKSVVLFQASALEFETCLGNKSLDSACFVHCLPMLLVMDFLEGLSSVTFVVD